MTETGVTLETTAEDRQFLFWTEIAVEARQVHRLCRDIDRLLAHLKSRPTSDEVEALAKKMDGLGNLNLPSCHEAATLLRRLAAQG